MTGSQEHDNFGRHPTLWTISAMHWVLENPDYRYKILLGQPIKEPAEEIDKTEELEASRPPTSSRRSPPRTNCSTGTRTISASSGSRST